jgi:hypothetical protein
MSLPQLSHLQLKLGRFLHTHRNVADCTAKDNLDSRELLLTSAGKEMDLPLTVSSQQLLDQNGRKKNDEAIS